MGTAIEGPYALGEIQLRFKRGAISKIAMLSKDRQRWTLVSQAVELSPKDELLSVPLSAVKTDEFMRDIPEMETPASPQPFRAEVLRGEFVRAEWVLVPAWVVVFVAALLPTASQNGSALFAWDVVDLVQQDGWRGAVVASAWLFVIVCAMIALLFTACSKGYMRSIATQVLSYLAITAAVVAFSAGSPTGLVTGLTLFFTLSAVRLANIALPQKSADAQPSRRSSCSVIELAVCLSSAVIASLVMIAAVVLKGNAFIPSGVFALLSAGAFIAAGMASSRQHTHRNLVIWMTVITMLFSVLAVTMEGTTTFFLNGTRMALFDAIRCASIAILTSICVHLALREMRHVSVILALSPVELHKSFKGAP